MQRIEFLPKDHRGDPGSAAGSWWSRHGGGALLLLLLLGAGTLAGPGEAWATNILSVGTGSEASGAQVTVPLSLDNDDVVKGLQTDIAFNPAVVSYVSGSATARVGTMGFSASVVEGNKVRVVMYYSDQNSLAAGTGAIANLVFQCVGAGGTHSDLAPGSSLLSGPNQESWTVTNVTGRIDVTGGGGGENILSVGTGSGANGAQVTVPLSLDNDDVVKGLQTDIAFNPAVVSYVSGSATARVGTMGFSASVVEGNKVRVVMYYSDQNSLAAGTGAIANLVFQCVGAGGTHSDLAPGSSLLSGPNQESWTVTNVTGRIDVTGGGGGENILSVGTGSGANGAQVTVPLSLDNDDVVKGLQTDISFDPAVVTFVSGAKTARVGTMGFSIGIVSNNTIRIVMFYQDANALSAGSGAIANLVFLLIGGAGTESALIPSAVELSDPAAQPLEVTTGMGEIRIEGGGPPAPVLRIAALKNPGRTRTLQLFVTSDQNLVQVPTVTAGGNPVSMAEVPGQLPGQVRSWAGSLSVAQGASSLQVQATGTNGSIPGTAQVTVNF